MISRGFDWKTQGKSCRKRMKSIFSDSYVFIKRLTFNALATREQRLIFDEHN